ncbi:diphosphate--fructose-6-phosphate 1-phosphotransferase [Candidatus Aerophobetes bacterium]|uniref:Pyrophosphate--fructose 6-phosphate 1-phosphotransferase n=1 Tax=Aerophobetes bacterium TaxID=2030807 RepID=A0A2A4YCM0_UNCAE|nr:MAG: diphosphate--fructose-6-phosphate 1-phosphotransferase [Candidatus Aerophobetes bacterium]
MSESPLLSARRKYQLHLPEIFENLASVCFEKNKETTSVSDAVEIKSLFPHLFGLSLLSAKTCKDKKDFPSFRVGVVLSGGQAAGGHNVIIGLFDALKTLNPDSCLIGFLNGPSGIIDGNVHELDEEFVSPYRNTGGFDLIGSGRTKIETEEQLKSSLETIQKFKLDGLVVIGGDDSNTNAVVLAEYLIKNGCTTKVVGVPKTIDGDLRNEYVEMSFGFDTACKTYSEMIGNLERDAISAKKYTHFVKLMGRSASHIALECALQTHPNYTFISEEVLEKKLTIKCITKELADLVEARSEKKKNYGVILIPEGLIEFIPEMKSLIEKLNDLLAGSEFASLDASASIDKVKKTLKEELLKTFEFLPEGIQKQLLLDRDPHGNVQVSHINTEKLFMETVAKELKQRDFKGSFSPVAHFFGYEGRAGFPSNFDATYCYALGYTAAALIKEGLSGYMACVNNLLADAKDWRVMGVPIISLMNLEMRKGKKKPVIQKALVDLDKGPFETFQKYRESWMLDDDYQFPGPIQFFGDPQITDRPPEILKLERS